MSDKDFSQEQNPWYLRNGFDNDVIISTRARFARNLANFPFVPNFRGDDKERIQSLIFDAFSHFENLDDYIFVNTSLLEKEGMKILSERGMLKLSKNPQGEIIPFGTGLVVHAGGNISCSINSTDHLHISSIRAGLDCRKAFEECREIDDKLQEYLQFAASCDFGYLTTSLLSAGSGIKFSAIIHIPAIVRSGKIKMFVDYLRDNGIKIMPAFLSPPALETALGCYYIISTVAAQSGSEIDQLAAFESVCKHLVESERKILAELADNKRTINRNTVIRAYSIAKFSMLVSLNEAIELIADIQFGMRLGLISGINNSDLSGLLYRVQVAHLNYLMNSGSFEFEKDVEQNQRLKADRLRAIILQETFDKISLENL